MRVQHAPQEGTLKMYTLQVLKPQMWETIGLRETSSGSGTRHKGFKSSLLIKGTVRGQLAQQKSLSSIPSTAKRTKVTKEHSV